MLYDQAQLVYSYLDAYQISKDEQHKEKAKGVMDYVIKYLTAPEGGKKEKNAKNWREKKSFIITDQKNLMNGSSRSEILIFPGIFSAEDADSLLEHGRPEHAEGAFYVW